MSFGKRLKLASGAAPITVKLPPKIWWSRKASLKPETVEARQVIQRLLKLLQVGDYAPPEEEDRVISSKLSSKQHSATPTEPSSDIMDRNPSLPTAVADDEAEEENDKFATAPLHCNSPRDENQREELQLQQQQEEEAEGEEQESDKLLRADSETSTNPASDDVEPREERAQSVPLAPPLQVTTRPISVSLNSQNLKRVAFEAHSGDSDHSGRDSLGSVSDSASTPERLYFGQIKKCIASIEDIVDSSRQLELRIRDKQARQL
ncbi:unnamed protein product [Phytophthora fragariaefolia]|uniref:Unnamed protein product n=1 Tax=Phytophthora fragariaefolia TaxID=1490495 RepID=A0A9W7CU19_9STRA|nr:unnamed protein product [Phytophthora fragariaefolia]